MKKIYGFVLLALMMLLFKEQAYAQENSELLLFNYENSCEEKELNDIEIMLNYAYGEVYDELNI